jgi:hypothetical protein
LLDGVDELAVDDLIERLHAGIKAVVVTAEEGKRLSAARFQNRMPDGVDGEWAR